MGLKPLQATTTDQAEVVGRIQISRSRAWLGKSSTYDGLNPEADR